MLLIFFILFAKVLADSDDVINKYIDLLPDEEKKHFIEKVARRIILDVKSQENANITGSVEIPDEDLKKHNEYVKAILKEEQDYVRRSKGEPTKEGEVKKSDEEDTLDVKPLQSEKKAIADDPDTAQRDLTLRNDRRGGSKDDNATDFIKVDIVIDEVPIIKRSIQNYAANDSESDESISETSEEIQSKIEGLKKELNQIERATEAFKNIKSTTGNKEVVTATTEGSKIVELTTVAIEHIEMRAQSESKNEAGTIERLKIKPNETRNEKFLKVTENAEKTTTIPFQFGGIGHTEPKIIESSETDGEDIKVKGLKSRRSSDDSKKFVDKTSESTEIGNITISDVKNKTTFDVENTTIPYIENKTISDGENTTISEVKNIPVSEDESVEIKSTENKSNENKSANVEEITTLTPIEEKTTTEIAPTTQENYETTELLTSFVPTSTQSDQKERNLTSEGASENAPESTPESTLTSTMTDDRTTELPIETTSYKQTTEILTTTHEPFIATRTEYFTESVTKPDTTITEGTKVIVEDFTSATNQNKSIDSSTEKLAETVPKEKKTAKQSAKKTAKQSAQNMVKTTTEKIEDDDEESIEATKKNVKLKLKQKRLEKSKVPSEKIKQRNVEAAKNKPNVDKNFIELEKVYFDNNYKVKTSKGYNVYELPNGKSPFIPDEEITNDQPYYVPVYTYSPNNAYYNPANRLGPNPDDASSERVGAFSIDDDANVVNRQTFDDDNQNIDIEYFDSAFDIIRKKFGSKQKKAPGIRRAPKSTSIKKYKVNPADYLDSDNYFGKARKSLERRSQRSFDIFPNSNEVEHPTHSINELSLKDHVRAVRNILYHQKNFGSVQEEEIEKLRKKKLRQRKQNEKSRKNTPALRENDGIMAKTDNKNNEKKENYEGTKNNNKNISVDYYLGRVKPSAVITDNIEEESIKNNHMKKVGYLKTQNNTQELYVMDDFFKENFVKFIKQLNTTGYKNNIKSDLEPATALSATRVQLLANDPSKFKEQEKKRNTEIIKNAEKKTILRTVARLVEENDISAIKKAIEIGESKNKNDTTNRTHINADFSKDNFMKVKANIAKFFNYNNSINTATKEGINLRLNRRNDVVKVDVYLQVLKDMISLDNRAVKQYDWLGTTVDIQASLQKLYELIDIVGNEGNIHPADMEILKYIIFLHNLATEIIDANDFGAQLRKELFFQRNKNKRQEKVRLLKEKGLINKVWLYLKKEESKVNQKVVLKNLNKFLMKIEDGVYELHDAIKNVAKITKYKHQHWYQNLKDLYLNTDEKHLLELLLHISVSRLFGLIEESARSGLEDDYVKYMKRHKKEAKKTLEELFFVIQILDEINKIVI